MIAGDNVVRDAAWTGPHHLLVRTPAMLWRITADGSAPVTLYPYEPAFSIAGARRADVGAASSLKGNVDVYRSGRRVRSILAADALGAPSVQLSDDGAVLAVSGHEKGSGRALAALRPLTIVYASDSGDRLSQIPDHPVWLAPAGDFVASSGAIYESRSGNRVASPPPGMVHWVGALAVYVSDELVSIFDAKSKRTDTVKTGCKLGMTVVHSIDPDRGRVVIDCRTRVAVVTLSPPSVFDVALPTKLHWIDKRWTGPGEGPEPFVAFPPRIANEGDVVFLERLKGERAIAVAVDLAARTVRELAHGEMPETRSDRSRTVGHAAGTFRIGTMRDRAFYDAQPSPDDRWAFVIDDGGLALFDARASRLQSQWGSPPTFGGESPDGREVARRLLRGADGGALADASSARFELVPTKTNDVFDVIERANGRVSARVYLTGAKDGVVARFDDGRVELFGPAAESIVRCRSGDSLEPFERCRASVEARGRLRLD